jgi:hypothetical protein
MTITPADRGIAFIKTNPDGTKNVYVAVGVGPGNEPEDIFAMHLNRPGVELGPTVKTVRAGSMVRTVDAVQVTSGSNDEVRLGARRTNPGPLFKG